MRGPLAGLMQQAQKMQEEVQRNQEELARMEIIGQAGGGLVTVTMSGRHEVRKVNIDKQTFADDSEMGEDLVAAAFNDAINKIAELTKQKMGDVTAGMNLPPGIKLPF
ncbi:MAG: YbaB/EbfC family nucleoid-associated protein [Dokdonella sp.]